LSALLCFVEFLEEIESVNRHIAIENPAVEKKYPTLIHCSAGVGRAGVAILVEVMKTCLEFNQVSIMSNANIGSTIKHTM
jgi:protein tyrosine phosphatase